MTASTEVITHIENQAQLIRKILRVLKVVVVVISIDNVLNVASRLRFLFTPGSFEVECAQRITQAARRVSTEYFNDSFYDLYSLLNLRERKEGLTNECR